MKRPQLGIDLDLRRRDDARKRIVDRPFQVAPVNDKLSHIVQDVRHFFRRVRAVLISAPVHHIPEQNAALECIDRIIRAHAERGHRQW